MAVQVTIYLNESDKWQGKPLHMAILNYLHDENVFAACTLHAVSGFLGRQRVKTSHLVDAAASSPSSSFLWIPTSTSAASCPS
jgi:PII-like signaling protein